MTFLKLAPFSQSYDFWIAVFFCMIASLIWLFLHGEQVNQAQLLPRLERVAIE